jgi:hypothetical protein
MIEDLGILLPPGSPANGMGASIWSVKGDGPQGTQVHTYRITTRAAGGNSGSVAAIESYFVGQPPSY